jgi:hypothetical protein
MYIIKSCAKAGLTFILTIGLLSSTFAANKLKEPYPFTKPSINSILQKSSVWLFANPSEFKPPHEQKIFSYLSDKNNKIWRNLHTLGIQMLYIDQIKQASAKDNAYINPKLGTQQEFKKIVDVAKQANVAIGCDIATNSTEHEPDFIIANDIKNTIQNFDCKILKLNSLTQNPSIQTTHAVWLINKLGGYSFQSTRPNISVKDFASISKYGANFFADFITQPALIYAALTQDTDLLKLMLNMQIQANINPQTLIHTIPNNTTINFNLPDITQNQDFEYNDIEIKGNQLKQYIINKLKKAGVKLNKDQLNTNLTEIVNTRFNKPNPAQKLNQQKLKTLITTFNATQPGIFAIPSSIFTNKQPDAFTQQLKALLSVRQKLDIASARLIDILKTDSTQIIISALELHNNKGYLLTALNFGDTTVEETINLHKINALHVANLVGYRIIDPVAQKISSFVQLHGYVDIKMAPLTTKMLYIKTK